MILLTADGNKVEIKKPTSEYWQKREELRAKRLYEQSDKTLGQLKAIFKESSDKMSKELAYFYLKYGIDSVSPTFETLEDGTQVLKGTSVKKIVTPKEAYKYGRLDSLIKKLNVILSKMATDQRAYMTTQLRLLAQESYVSGYFMMFQGYGVGYGFDVLDDKVITQIINAPVHGQNFSTRIWKNKDLLANQVNQELVNGITQGLSVRQMTQRINNRLYYRGQYGSAYKVAEGLMRTETTNTYAQATLRRYKDSGIVKEYQYVATLDNRTSEVCQALDLQVFKIEDAVTGLNYPPMHPRCRSTTIAKFDYLAFERRARNEQGNTYTVPANMTYGEWQEKYLNAS